MNLVKSLLFIQEKGLGEDALHVLFLALNWRYRDEPVHAWAGDGGLDQSVDLLELETDVGQGAVEADGVVELSHLESSLVWGKLVLAEDWLEQWLQSWSGNWPDVLDDGWLEESETLSVGELRDERGERVFKGVGEVQERLVERHATDRSGVGKPVSGSHVIVVLKGSWKIASNEDAHLTGERLRVWSADGSGGSLHNVVESVDSGESDHVVVHRQHGVDVVDGVVWIDNWSSKRWLVWILFTSEDGDDSELVDLGAGTVGDVDRDEVGSALWGELELVKLAAGLVSVLKEDGDRLGGVTWRASADGDDDEVLVVLLREHLDALVANLSRGVGHDLVVVEVRNVALLEDLHDRLPGTALQIRGRRGDETNARWLEVIHDVGELADSTDAEVASLLGAVDKLHDLVDVCIFIVIHSAGEVER